MKKLLFALVTLALSLPVLGQGSPTLQFKTVAEMVAHPVPSIATRLSAIVSGRSSTNDGGGGVFTYEASDATSTNLGTIFKPTVGNGRWLRQYSGALNVKWFGAKGDNVTSDTAAIQAAITEAEIRNVSIYIPSGSYLLTGSGTELLLISEAISITGDGPHKSMLVIGSAVGATVDCIRVHPAVATELRGMRMADFGITPASGTPGRYGINLDQTDGVIANLIIDNIFVAPLGDSAIYAPTGVTGALFTSTIENSYLSNGIRLTDVADSIHIANNLITGNGAGIDASFVAGAGAFEVTGNNITSKGGGVRIVSTGAVQHPIIVNNYIENNVIGYDATKPGIYITGTATVAGPVINHNLILSAHTANTDALSLDNVEQPYISGNTLYAAGTGVPIRLTVNTSDPMIGQNECGDGTCEIVGPSTARIDAVFQYSGEVASTTPTLKKADGLDLTAIVIPNLIGANNLIVSGGSSTTADLSFKTTTGVGASGADMHFLVGTNGATEAMTILNSGNVGIGTVSPQGNLDIVSALNPTVNIATAGDVSTAKTLLLQYASSGYGRLQAYDYATGAKNVVLQDLGGNVGIGTTNPQQKLHVEGTTSAIARMVIRNSAADGIGNTASLLFAPEAGFSGAGTVGTVGASISALTENTYSTGLEISTFNQDTGLFGERVRIKYDGKVGILTNAPSEALEVLGNVKANGNVTITNTSTADRSLTINHASGGTNSIMLLTSGGSNRVTIAESGRITTVEDFYASGGSYFGGGGVYIPATQSIRFSGGAGRSRIYAPADGDFLFVNAASNNFGKLQFGGTSSSFPALKRSTTTLQARLADDSSDAAFGALSYTVAGTTNQIVFGSTNSVPSDAVNVAAWISVQVTGDTNVYRLPLYK